MKRFTFFPAIRLALVAGLLFLTACDGNDNTTFVQEYVVENYLFSGEPLTQVRLSQTASVDEAWDFNELAVSDATVRLDLLDDNNNVEKTYSFTESNRQNGIYLPDASDIAEPLRTYRLSIDVPGFDRTLSATTIVPDTFSVITTRLDTVVFQGSEQFEVDVTRSSFPGRQNVYIFTTEALDPREELLTPLAADLYDNGEGDFTLEDFRRGSSPLLNEANYTVNADGSLTIGFPWIAVAFVGPNILTASAIDQNVFNYISSNDAQGGGSTLSPGEIPNILDPIENGRGIFGSMARQSVDIMILPPPGFGSSSQ